MQEYLHHKGGVGENSLNYLSFLPNSCTDFRKQVGESGLALGCWRICNR